MKSSLNRLKFAFRFAFKNLIHFKIRSILIIFGFLALCVSLFMGLSMQGFFKAFFYGELEEQYNQIDITMGISPYANARFFSISNLDDPSLEDIIDDAIPFFEITTLVETPDGTKVYVNTMASTLMNFKKVSNQKTYLSNELDSDEMMITKSFANKHDLSVGSRLTLFAGNTNKEFYIVEIIDDGRLFQKDSIYLNKSTSISFFLSSLSSSFDSIPSAALINLYNIVYIDVKPEISFDEAISSLKEIDSFSNLNYSLAIDSKAVDQMVYRNVSVFNMIIAMVSLSVLIVMQTTFLIYFDEKKKTFATVDLLGGTKIFSYSIVLIELFILLIISFLLAIFASNLIISYGVRFLGSTITYRIQPEAILLSSSIIVLLFLISSIYYFIRFNKESSIQQSKDQGKEKKDNMVLYTSIALISLAIYVVSLTPLAKSYLGYYSSLVSIFISIVLLFSLSYSLLHLLTYYLSKRKNNFVFLLHLKILLSKKAFYQYTAVILVSFVSLFLLILTNDHMDKRIAIYKNEFSVDFALSNFISRYDQTYLEISNLPLVEDIDQVGLFTDIDIASISQNVNFVFAIDSNRIDTYFDIDIPDEVLSSLDTTDHLVIILPIRYQLIYHLEIDQVILLNISPAYQNQSFTIGGFFEKQLGNLAFTNLNLVAGYEDIAFNTLLVNSTQDRLLLKDQLLESYSKNMVYIFDFQDELTELTNDMRRATEYLTLIISIIIFCFVLAIINHSSLLLGQMKDSYSRLFVLGYSRKKMRYILAIESLFVFVIIFISSLISYILIGTQLNRFILLFGEYENIVFSVSSLYVGASFIFIVYLVVKLIYIYQVNQLNYSDVLKTH